MQEILVEIENRHSKKDNSGYVYNHLWFEKICCLYIVFKNNSTLVQLVFQRSTVAIIEYNRNITFKFGYTINIMRSQIYTKYKEKEAIACIIKTRFCCSTFERRYYRLFSN